MWLVPFGAQTKILCELGLALLSTSLRGLWNTHQENRILGF